MWSTKQKIMSDLFYFICLFYKDKLTKMAPSTKPEEVLAMFHCPLCQHAAHARTSRYITDTTKERYHQCQNVNCSATFITYESVQRYIVSREKSTPLDRTRCRQGSKLCGCNYKQEAPQSRGFFVDVVNVWT